MKNFGALLNGPDLWMRRDDLSGLEGGGNKTRKLEFLAGDALRTGCDMLVTVGAIQSNHTRQTASSAAKAGMKCALLHCARTEDAGPNYRNIGNVLLSSLMGADPVYVGRAIRGLLDLSVAGRFSAGNNILLMHLGGSPAIHAYSGQFGPVELTPFPAG